MVEFQHLALFFLITEQRRLLAGTTTCHNEWYQRQSRVSIQLRERKMPAAAMFSVFNAKSSYTDTVIYIYIDHCFGREVDECHYNLEQLFYFVVVASASHSAAIIVSHIKSMDVNE